MIDRCVAPPKSASLLQLGRDERLSQALVPMAEEIMQETEAEAAVRLRTGGANETRQTGNFLVILFAELTNRENEPQSHIHSNVVPATKAADGVVRALDLSLILEKSAYLAAVERSVFAYHLTQFGYRLRLKDDSFEVAEIDDASSSATADAPPRSSRRSPKQKGSCRRERSFRQTGGSGLPSRPVPRSKRPFLRGSLPNGGARRIRRWRN
jgi:conjugative relaxase-like TrwC/TraI family protein